MPELVPLRAGHAQQVLAFELTNRAYFASSVSDRGDEYFHHFGDRFRDLLAEQEAGVGAYYLLTADDGSVMGRYNLIFVHDGAAKLGYRVAQQHTGRGLATATVEQLCRLAATRHGLHLIRAAAASANPASQKVLTKAGFVMIGPAEPADIGGKQGNWYQRDLADQEP